MLLNKSKLTVKQVELVRKARKYFGTKNVVTRTELVKFMKSLGLKSSPGFITKNLAFKLKNKAGDVIRGKYKLPNVSSARKTVTTAKKSVKKVETLKPVETVVEAPKVLTATSEVV